jgi:hypothetical protein
VQEADFFSAGVPGVRERKMAGDLNLICQMLAGCSSTAAAFLGGQLPPWDDGANFLSWFHEWMGNYLASKGLNFETIRAGKAHRLGVITAEPAA